MNDRITIHVVAVMSLVGDGGDVLDASPTPKVGSIVVYRTMAAARRNRLPDQCLVLIRTEEPLIRTEDPPVWTTADPPRRVHLWARCGTIIRIWLPREHWDRRDAVAARYGVPVELPPCQHAAIYGVLPRRCRRRRCRQCSVTEWQEWREWQAAKWF